METAHPIANADVCYFRTICEVHREMHDILINEDCVDEKLVGLLQEAFTMAKKMDKKLRQYHSGYDKGWWETTSNVEQKLDKRKRNVINESHV